VAHWQLYQRDKLELPLELCACCPIPCAKNAGLGLIKDFQDRKKLSFEQAEGAEPLPAQLQLRALSPELRAVLWNTIHEYLQKSVHHPNYGRAHIVEPWLIILKEEHVYRHHRMVDDFVNDPKSHCWDTTHI
jgi:hypothetical protein